MFEREIHKAKERLTKTLSSNGQFTYWFEIQASTLIAPFHRRFFEAEANWWVFEHQMVRSANPRFDFTHERLSYHLLNADHYLVESSRFDRQDLAATIDLGVKTRFNYLIRPRTTLRWFVFRGEPTKTLQEILLRLDYFSGYDYLIEGFRLWATHKRLSLTPVAMLQDSPEPRPEIISVVEFDRILQNADNEHILDLSPAQFVELTQPIFELFGEVYNLPPDQVEIPTAALVVFLDDKGIQPIARELENSLREEDLQTLTQKGFLWVLSDIISALERNASGELMGERMDASERADAATLPLDFTAPQAAEPKKSAVTSSIETSLVEISLAETMEPSLKHELIHTLFHHDERAFHDTVRQLDEARSWRESASLIEEVTESLGVNPNMELVQRLRELVYKQHSRRQ